MSHAAAVSTKPGQPEIIDLDALRAACEARGLEMVPGTHYRTWKDDHGRFVGDWAPPEGFDPSKIGDNAEYVIRIPGAKAPPGGTAPYELGVVPDPKNPGCYVLMGDFFAGGYGLAKHTGEAIVKGKAVECLAPTLMMHYRMECDRITAAAQGDKIEFEPQADGSFVSWVTPNLERLQNRDSFGG